MWTYMLIVVGLLRAGLGQSPEPSPCSWQETNLKIVERLAVLETEQTFLKDTISRQQQFIDDMVETVMKQWGSWSEWSACAFKCKGSDASTSPDDQYGVAYDYRDQMAQVTCTALLDTGGAHVYVVRRACSSLTVPCAEVCSSL
ncbi:hypothetical protein MAR_015367, partial [Mya arenaria]